jgi:hypothetical protein
MASTTGWIPHWDISPGALTMAGYDASDACKAWQII